VRIGDLTPPRSGVVLDLNGSNNTATAGLGLPVVALTDVASPLPLAASFDDLAGVVVYNTAVGNGLRVGIYFVAGSQWVRVLTDLDAIDFPFVYTNSDHTAGLYMLPYNLGVTDEGKSMTVAQQMEAAKGLNSSNDVPAITGYLFQWGRIADGHQLRDTSSVSGHFLYSGVKYATYGVSVDNTSGQVAEGSDGYGQFILRESMGMTEDWRQYGTNNATNPPTGWIHNPCSSVKDGGKAWRLPTQGEWQQIIANNSPDINSTTTPKGLSLRPDGSTISVFLPAVGYRYFTTGDLYNVGTIGYYWSSSPSSANASSLYFSTTVYPAFNNDRSYGYSIRCVAE
jgi:uncharacterized protein (TIGR02145 family)